MTDSPDAVMLYIPLMKETNMTWREIKNTPRIELESILAACYEYNLLHSMDGYEAKDIRYVQTIIGIWLNEENMK